MLPLYYTSLNVAPSYGYLNDNNLWGRAGKGGGGDQVCGQAKEIVVVIC